MCDKIFFLIHTQVDDFFEQKYLKLHGCFKIGSNDEQEVHEDEVAEVIMVHSFRFFLQFLNN